MNIKIPMLLLFIVLAGGLAKAQEGQANIVLISLDGFRWQELFSGADSLLVAHSDYVHDTTELRKLFWRSSPMERRKALLPFVWNTVASIGRIHGNRNHGSKVDLTNAMWFSYPGYNEILTGKADDDRITSNDKIPNPNRTFLEIAHSDTRYHGKVAAFGSWDVFPYIINEERSGVPVNAGFDVAKGDDITEREKFLNELQPKVPSPWGSVRLDAFTHYFALEEMKKNHPKVVYIAYGETDDFAHDGDYGAYLKSAHTTDTFIKELWDFTQSDSFYKNNTLFVITTDHGRGTQPLDTWKSHGSEIAGAGSVWLIAFGKGVKAKGEVTTNEQLFSNQIAPTILQLLGLQSDDIKMPGAALNFE
ncbi:MULTISPECIES: sulfatase-like hydrolase/transferase [Maribacter]|uniref:Sulfatase-like hydrolase/transferase n=1 Tax=Maribacter flavus TaxID=1658664 RepID=A0ABU7IHB0_9FLAO|nr:MULTISPECIES: sulfatase-like hydrolase/transferase [Maribacter]MDC6404924.1 sulfatase-like hydrolase/transferase [Maribacter sp. PR66]MEE1972338.1 sulfatase-like hydrolase/transferase [Maribacter flavus]